MHIKSAYGIEYHVKVENHPIIAEDISFIKNMSFNIMWNNSDCYYWTMDKKLPSGRWLENIRSFDSIHFTALIV